MSSYTYWLPAYRLSADQQAVAEWLTAHAGWEKAVDGEKEDKIASYRPPQDLIGFDR